MYPDKIEQNQVYGCVLQCLAHLLIRFAPINYAQGRSYGSVNIN